MQHVRAAVIGGGVTGCSILYHLARMGWRDIALFERRDLTAGATWHSSGHVAHYTKNPLLTRLALETRELVHRIESEADQPIGLIETGSLRLAQDRDAFRNYESYTNTLTGVACDAHMVSPAEAAAMWPLADMSGIEGGLFVPVDCRLNAADFTQALARAARKGGAVVHRETEVTGLTPRLGSGWIIQTNQGDWTADHVITATGIFARRTLRALGINLPVSVVSHQYLVTETVDAVAERMARGCDALPILRQPDIGLNIREERDGFCISLYEQNASSVFPDGPPADFGMSLFPDDFESIETGFEAAMERVPSLAEAGISSTVHGPMPWSPDFAPIVGPVFGHRGLWAAEAMSYGVTWSGGVGRLLAQWIVEGDPGMDTAELDPRRFGTYANADWADAHAISTYKGVYGSGGLDEVATITDLHDVFEAQGAEFAERDGYAIATRVPAGNGIVEMGAIHAPGPVTVLYVNGPGAADFLSRLLVGFAAPGHGIQTRAWLPGPGEAIAAHVRIRWKQDADGFEVEIETGCPRAVSAEFTERAATESNVVVACPERKLEILVVLGSPPDFTGIGADRPKDPSEVVTTYSLVGRVEGRVVCEPDLAGIKRWRFVHDADHHRAIFDACRRSMPDAVLLGTADYGDMQIASCEPVIGRNVTAEFNLDGVLVSDPGVSGAKRSQLTQVSVLEEWDGGLRPDMVLRNHKGAVVGRLIAVGDGDRAFATVAPEELVADARLNVRTEGQNICLAIRPLTLRSY